MFGCLLSYVAFDDMICLDVIVYNLGFRSSVAEIAKKLIYHSIHVHMILINH